jgi:hypothetical protein
MLVTSSFSQLRNVAAVLLDAANNYAEIQGIGVAIISPINMFILSILSLVLAIIQKQSIQQQEWDLFYCSIFWQTYAA